MTIFKDTELTEREEYTIWRKRNKVKLVDVANYLGISESAISRWERYERHFKDNKQELYNKFIEQFESQRA
jgi:DNA-binding transcriptional regulator YiaG